MTGDADVARMHLAQAYTRAVHPDARRHIRAALQRLDGETPACELVVECPSCGRVGLPERIADCDCPPHANPDPIQE
jgi:uncharacterized OB-fold protein